MQRVEVEKSEPVTFLPIAYRQAAYLSAARGEFDKAVETLKKIPVDRLRNGMNIALRALFLGLAGEVRRAKQAYEKLRKHYSFASPFQIAIAASGAGDNDEAVFWLTAAAEIRDPLTMLIGVHPVTRHLRNHAGFRSLLTQTMKLRLPE
jgi:tetratricopeptide (TPR) repeat protein